MIDNWVLMQPDGPVHTITDIGTTIPLLENIKQTGMNTTQDGTTDTVAYPELVSGGFPNVLNVIGW